MKLKFPVFGVCGLGCRGVGCRVYLQHILEVSDELWHERPGHSLGERASAEHVGGEDSACEILHSDALHDPRGQGADAPEPIRLPHREDG